MITSRRRRFAHGLLAGLLVGVLLPMTVQAEDPVEGEPGVADQVEAVAALTPEGAAMAVLDAFMEAFNSRDMEAWEATYHFPHFRLANGTLTVTEDAGRRSSAGFAALAASGWDHSAWLSREIVQADDQKVHVAVEFARFDAEGEELARYHSLYVVTFENDRWGIRGRSSFAP